MLTLFGPILAQVVTVGAALRTEGRAVVIDTDKHYEAATRPALTVDLSERRLRFDLIYSPSFTLTPLEGNPDLLVSHFVGVSMAYGWRRTTLTVAEYASYGVQNFRVLATAGAVAVPGLGTTTGQAGGTTDGGTMGTGTSGTGNSGTGTTGTGATGTGAPGAVSTGTGATGTSAGTVPVAGQTGTSRLLNQNVLYASTTTSSSLTHVYSRQLSLGGTVAYIVAGAVEAKSRGSYPLIRGPLAAMTLADRFGGRDIGTLSLSAQESVSSNGTATWLWGTLEGWNHGFNPKTSTQLAAGVSAGRTSRSDGYVAYSVYPTFVASLLDVEHLSPGSLAFNLTVSSAPAIDPLSLALDPRIGFGGGITWQRERLAMTVSAIASISVSGHQQNALSSVGGGAGASYLLSKAVSADCGLRGAYQTYQGQTILPFSYAGYVGLSIGLSRPLHCPLVVAAFWTEAVATRRALPTTQWGTTT